jgi:transglutaminase-like putative cysteine protease
VDRVRGISLDRWEDGGWYRSAPPSFDGVVLDETLAPLPVAAPVAPAERERYRVTVAYSGLEQLLAPGDPVAIGLSEATPLGRIEAFPAADGAVLFEPPLPAGTTLIVESRHGDATPAELALVDAGVSAPSGADYVQLGDLSPSGREAGAASRSRATVAERQDAVGSYLETRVCRTRHETTALEHDDPVNTLLEGRPGTIEDVNAAAVLLLRAGGVPARFATGYRAGTPDTLGRQRVSLAGAITWVDVWYGPRHGWQAWEPAAAVPFCPPALDPAPPTTAPPPPPDEPFKLQLPQWVPFTIVGVILAGLVFWWWRRRQARLAVLAARPWTQRIMDDVYDEAGRRGQRRPGSQTLVDYTTRVGATVLPEPELAEVGAAVGRELYSPHPPDPAARGRAEALVERAVAAAEAREKEERRQRRAERMAKANPANWRRRRHSESPDAGP